MVGVFIFWTAFVGTEQRAHAHHAAHTHQRNPTSTPEREGIEKPLSFGEEEETGRNEKCDKVSNWGSVNRE